MTTPRDSPRRLIGWTIAVVTATALGVWLLVLLRDVVLLIYVSALFAIGFSPVVRYLERQRRFWTGTRRVPRWVAILIVYLAILGLLAAVGLAILPPLIRQAREFATRLPELLEQAQGFLIARGILAEPITLREAIEHAPAGGTDAVGTVVAALWGLLGGAVGLVTILILTFYLVVESDAILTTFVRLFPRQRRPLVATVVGEIGRKVSAWLGGQLVLAAVIGGSAAIGLGLMGVPYFYVLAVIAGVGEMIPVVGPLLAAIPAIAVALGVSGKLALFVAIFFLIQQQVENHVLVPKLMERQVGVSAVTVIIALLVGSSLLGIVGALLAVPSAAIAQVLLQELVLGDDGPG